MAGLAILCSGQGRQSSAMFEKLREYPEALAVEQEIRAAGLYPQSAGDQSLLFANHIAQPLICLYQAMIWAVVGPELPEVELFAGYSLGELSAYACTGMLTPGELLRLAAFRGKVMSMAAKQPQTMLAVLGLKMRELEVLAQEFGAFLAIRNGESHLIFGIKQEGADCFRAAALAAGASRVVRLPVSVAAHTPLLKEAADAFGKELEKVPPRRSRAAVLSSINTERIYDRDGMLKALTGQIHQTIDWQGSMETALACGCRVFLEIGPGDSLARMLHQEFPGSEVRSLSEFQNLKAAAKWANAALQRQ